MFYSRRSGRTASPTLLFIATLIWLLTACGGQPEPTPVPVAIEPPTISEPKISAPTPQEPSQEIGISVDVSSASGVSLTYEWQADGGDIVRGDGSPAITYRTPAEPGIYNVRVTVKWDTSSVEKVTTIRVEAPEPDTPTPEPPTDTPTPEPDEPSPTATVPPPTSTLEPTATLVPTTATPLPPTNTPQPTDTFVQPDHSCNDLLGCVIIAPGEPIRIASALVTAGPNETLGIDSQRGVEIAISDRGQVVGHNVELVAKDSSCSSDGGRTAAATISSDDSIVAVVGHNCSSSCRPAARIYNDAGLTMISPSCTASSLTAPGTHVSSFLRTAHNDNIQGRVMAEFVYNELGLRTAATIHDNSPYAEQLQQVFAQTFIELGGTVTAQEAINIGDTDMQPVLSSIAADSPQLLFYPIFVAEGAFVTIQAGQIAGLENTILAGADGMASFDFIAAAGNAAEGMYISGPDLSFTNDKYEQFRTSHEAKYGEAPLNAFHAQAYDAANLIFNAVEAVATQDAQGNTSIGRKALRDALYLTSGYDGMTGNLSCNELGDCADSRMLVNQIQNGEYVTVFRGH